MRDLCTSETRKIQRLSRDSVLRILEDQEKLSCDLEAWKKKKDDRSINLNKLEEERNNKKMKDELAEKEEKLGSLEELSQTLITKERQSNDELQEEWKELIQVFVDILGGRTTIGTKKMGEIDPKPFQNACKQKFSPEEAQVQASTLCSLWQKNLKNPEWHPFKIIEGGGNAKPEVACLISFLPYIVVML
ncbi:hypothetical protein Patl1_34751 [Pistacia atlantica]|uniref:Uncharacterized protein n=1 Tax=Pistacia atlantica TaxID=434234 RepID=A0ACC0ZU09_9ROSI|nr:hypothetical protein Patl1_34751 [Pistacia atlantica]